MRIVDSFPIQILNNPREKITLEWFVYSSGNDWIINENLVQLRGNNIYGEKYFWKFL